jgi:two-component system KDP operon response regulator KdpE
MLFEANGFRVIIADTGARGEQDARLFRPDVVLVDLGLPDLDGLNVITALRTWSPVPIIVLTARSAEAQRLAAFERGADDYVLKPFSAPELLARVRAIVRRHVRGELPMGVLELGDVSVDMTLRVARRVDGCEVRLTPLEHRILETLVRHGDRIVTHTTLLKEVWGIQSILYVQPRPDGVCNRVERLPSRRRQRGLSDHRCRLGSGFPAAEL